jgi:hypothetical protein
MLAAAFFVAEQPAAAANFCNTEQGYHISFIGTADCFPYWSTFCFEMDLECAVDCTGPWYGICFDWSNPCEYYCCCKEEG